MHVHGILQNMFTRLLPIYNQRDVFFDMVEYNSVKKATLFQRDKIVNNPKKGKKKEVIDDAVNEDWCDISKDDVEEEYIFL